MVCVKLQFSYKVLSRTSICSSVGGGVATLLVAAKVYLPYKVLLCGQGVLASFLPSRVAVKVRSPRSQFPLSPAALLLFRFLYTILEFQRLSAPGTYELQQRTPLNHH